MHCTRPAGPRGPLQERMVDNMKKTGSRKDARKKDRAARINGKKEDLRKEIGQLLHSWKKFELDEVDKAQLATVAEFKELRAEIWSRFKNDIVTFYGLCMPTYSPRLVRFFSEEIEKKLEKSLPIQDSVMLLQTSQRRHDLRDQYILYWLHYRFSFGGSANRTESSLLFLFYFPRFFVGEDSAVLDEQTAIDALANEEEARRIVKSHEALLEISCLLYNFEIAARDELSNIWPAVKQAYYGFNDYRVETMSDLDRASDYLTRFIRLRRTLKHQLGHASKWFEQLEANETFAAHFPKMSDKTLFELGDFLLNDFDRLKESYVACLASFKPSFDADATIELLKRVTPPLDEEDMRSCVREVELLRSGEMDVAESGLLNVILPAMQGRRPFVLREDRHAVKGQFSLAFFLDIEDGKFSIAARSGPATDLNEPDAALQDGDEEGGLEEAGTLDADAQLQDEEGEGEDAGSLPVEEDAEEDEDEEEEEEEEEAEVGEDVGEDAEDGSNDGEDVETSLEEEEPSPGDLDQDAGPDRAGDADESGEPAGAVEAAADERLEPSSSDGIEPEKGKPGEEAGRGEEAFGEADMDPAGMPDGISRLGQKLLDEGHTAAYHWLCGKTRCLAPRWLAELLHLGLHIRPKFTEASLRLRELLQTAINEYSNLSQEESLLLTAALIKPLLFQPQTSCIPMLSDLANKHKAYEPFLLELRRFLARSQPIDEHALTGRSAEDMRAVELASLKEATRDFLARMSKARVPFRLGSTVIHDLFSSRGEFGFCLEACLQDNFEPLHALLAKDWDEDAQKELIQEVNLRVNRKKRLIQAGARTTILGYIRHTLNLCEEWRRLGEMRSDEDDNELLKSLIKSIRETDLASTAEERLLQNCLRDLGPNGARTAGTLCMETLDPAVELELWPLVLPTQCPGDDETCAYRVLRDMPDELLDGPMVDTVAEHAHMGELALVNRYIEAHKSETENVSPDRVRRFMAEHAYAASPDPDNTSLSEIWRAETRYWNAHVKKQEELCQQRISDASFRGSILFSHQTIMREKCSKALEWGLKQHAPLEALQGFRAITDELDALDAELEKQLLERLAPMKKAAQNENFVSMQAKLEDIETRLIKEEKLFNYALVALEDVQAHLDSSRDMDRAEKAERDILSCSRDFYRRLEQEPDSLAFKDREAYAAWKDVGIYLHKNETMRGRETQALTRLVRLLGFSLEGDVQPEEKSREGGPCFWRIVQVRASIDSPLPQWGSRSGDTHTFLLGWDITPERLHQKLSNSLNASGPLNRQKAVTVLCFNKLTFEDRKRIIGIFKALNFSALLLDECLYNWVSEQDDKVHALFGAALAGAACNPYTPNVAGAVPKEMFFGRKSLIGEVSRMDGSCIVYGGRQLGKTALLQQVASQEGEERLVIQFSLPSMTTLLDSLFNELQKKEDFRNINHRNFVHTIERYLWENPGRSILVLADECDKALEEDEKEDFRQVRILSDLMQKTGRRFKIVLTGLHSVQRFSQVANVPFIHFGTPICVGPLSPGEACDLLVRPLQWLGIEFEDKQLAYLATSHCNYHPKVVQMLGEELLKAINSSNEPRGPLFTVTKQLLYDVLTSRELQKKILECFDITLNLDERYLVIGYVMAILMLHGDYGTADGGLGIHINELYDELCLYWPAAFCNKQGDLTMLESLLHEMVGLGLLSNVDKSYLLRTPNIINLLGGEETIESRLSQYAEKPYEPHINLEGWRVVDSEAFVASQYSLLAEKRNGLVFVVGSRALGLDDVPKALKSIADEQGLGKCIQLHGADAKSLKADMQHKWSKSSGSSHSVLFWASSAECAFIPEFMLLAASWLKTLSTGKRFARVVCLLDPSSYFEFSIDAKFEALRDNPDIIRIELRRWTAQSVETWCRLKGKAAPDDVSALMEETGGWHALLFPRLEGKTAPEIGEFFRERGVAFPDRPEVQGLLSAFVYGDLSQQDIQDELEDEAPERVQQTLLLLRELHVVEHADESGEKFRLAPGIAASFEERRQ